MNTVILPPLLNREFKLPDDGMFQFAPLGEYPIQDPVTKNRVIQVVDAEAVRLMAADIAAQKAKPNWPGLLVDRDHFSYDTSKESRAAGWANDGQARQDGLFGPIRFTNSGKADVEGGEFRFLSPVFDRKSAVPLGGSRFRVTRLLGLALTNTPNIRNIQALTNRAEDFHGLTPTTTAKDTPTMNKVIALLGLAATASEDEIAAGIQALKNRLVELEPFKGKFTSLESEHNALKGKHTALLNTSVDKTLEQFKGVITAESKDAWKNRLTADFEGTVALLNGIKKPAAEGKRTPIHKGGKAVDVTVDDGDDAQDAFMNRVGEVMVARKLDKADAIAAVAGEEPALYEAYRSATVGGEQ